LFTGGDLFSYVESKGKLSDVESAVILMQILKAVEYLHGQGVVHRDLKPDNILMSSRSGQARIVLTDFGSARLIPGDMKSDRTARMVSLIGTPEFCAPYVTL
jgi:pheromone a factor receptor